MSARLRLEQLLGRTIERWPYVWVHFPPASLVSSEDAAELARTFPAEGFRHTARLDAKVGEKRYDNWNLDIVDRSGGGHLSTLPPVWREFAEQFLDGRYLRDMMNLLEVPGPRDVRLEMRMTEYRAATWMDPHTDRADKVFAHVLYFTTGWYDGCGGELGILGSSSPDDVAALVPPTLGASAALRRSERSWHAVRHTAQGTRVRRRALLVHAYWNRR
jgi:2OG-Fe(II) oxygenase superfamily